MVKSDVFWQLFARTGHVGAYVLYKDYDFMERNHEEEMREKPSAIVAGGEFWRKGDSFLSVE